MDFQLNLCFLSGLSQFYFHSIDSFKGGLSLPVTIYFHSINGFDGGLSLPVPDHLKDFNVLKHPIKLNFFA